MKKKERHFQGVGQWAESEFARSDQSESDSISNRIILDCTRKWLGSRLRNIDTPYYILRIL